MTAFCFCFYFHFLTLPIKDMHTNRAILFGQFDRNLITESLWTFGIHFDSITLKLQRKASYTFEFYRFRQFLVKG